jgi:dihydrofolate synthase/folylpolyglutamate synthase
MAYSDLVGWMFKLERFGIKLGLENMTEFLSRIGDPHNEFRSVHVTGTNGKGSVCAFLASILQETGLKVGLYTSPHLVDFRERITVSGKMIPEEDVVRIGESLKAIMDKMAEESGEKQLTFFEFTTGLAFEYFNEQKVDVAVLEVGMGGRLDATNVVIPEVAVITRIGLEHTAYLGNTVEEIAREKVGIIKPGIPVISSERHPGPLDVIRSACKRKRVGLRLIDTDFRVKDVSTTIEGTSFDYEGRWTIGGLSTNLIGVHQAENAAVAIATAEQLADQGYPVSLEAVRDGISRMRWPGRLQIQSTDPLIIIDGSHNPEGVKASVSALVSLGLTPLTFVVACMNDKDAQGIMSALLPHASTIVATEIDIDRTTKADQLSEAVGSRFDGGVYVEREISGAMLRASSSGSGKGICVIGSLYLVGEVMKWLDTQKSPSTRKV